MFDFVGGLLLLGIGLLIYFLPVVVALVRGCRAIGGIVVLNLFLGWTFIGWVVALAWSAGGDVDPACS